MTQPTLLSFKPHEEIFEKSGAGDPQQKKSEGSHD